MSYVHDPELDKLTSDENAALCLLLEEQIRQLERENPAYRAWRALMLATTPDIWSALLLGESVPLSSLDPKWVKRFGLR